MYTVRPASYIRVGLRRFDLDRQQQSAYNGLRHTSVQIYRDAVRHCAERSKQARVGLLQIEQKIFEPSGKAWKPDIFVEPNRNWLTN